MGWALKNLTLDQRAAIAESLFQVVPGACSGGWLNGLCPLHDDHNPSFGYNPEMDVFHCQAGCSKDGDLVDLYCRVNGLDASDGFIKFKNEFSDGAMRGHGNSAPTKARTLDSRQGQSGITNKGMHSHAQHGNDGQENPAPTNGDQQPEHDLEDVWKKFPPLPDNWVKRLIETRHFTAQTIRDMDLRLQTWYRSKNGDLVKVNKPERIAIPIRDRAGILRNIRLYMPGASQAKIISWGKGYGSSRLFPAWPRPDGSPVLLCEGEMDAICAISHGFNAITQTSKTKAWKVHDKAVFEGHDVVVAYDADAPGQDYAQAAAKCLVGAARSVRVLVWPDFMGRLDGGKWPDKHGEDLTDFFVKHGKDRVALNALMDSAVVYAGPGLESKQVRDATGAVLDVYEAFFTRGENFRLSFRGSMLAEKLMQDKPVLHEPGTGLLYRWNGRYWEEYYEDHLKAYAVKLLDLEAKKERVNDAIFQARALSAIPHGRAVNDMGDWVCLQNGMFNLETAELKPHAKDYYCTHSLGVEFLPKSGRRCTRWLAYLQETVQTPGPIAQLQEFMGYCLIRDTRFGKCLLLKGPGADGKSVFLKILRKLVGPENCAAVSFGDLEDHFQRSALYGKLVNISTEVGSKALASPYFKAIVTGDPINAAFKHKDAFSFSPYCKLAFAANKLPRVLDNSDGFFRRVLPVQFKRQFLGKDDDKDLEDKLTEELSAIFLWALAGLQRLRKQGAFTECREMYELLKDYKRFNNPVLCYVDDECRLEEGGQALKDDLYGGYRAYCSANGYNPMAKENFFVELYAAKASLRAIRPRINGKREHVVAGISIVNPHAESGD